MSSLLEQAIVDAAALRDAALKNAEAAIVEKYAPEIKNAVDSLLEQELGVPELEELPEPAATAAEAVDAPPAYAEGEDACPCPEDGEKVEMFTIDMGDMMDIVQQMDAEEEELETHEEVADELAPEELPDEEQLREATKESDEIVLDEEAIAALVEELVVDIDPQKSGWAGTPEPVMRHNEELELARRAATEAKEETEQLKKAVEELSESKERLKESNRTLKEAVLKLKDACDEMSVSNAKLIYTNRILSSTSLNERQKENIVEAISKAGSVNEAKVIYETLQSTGGTSRRKPLPQSLSEAIKRPSSTVLPRRQPERTTDTAIDRLQILAGIKHNK